MSQENVEIVRQGFEVWEAAWNSGTEDLGALLALFDDDLVTRRLAPMPEFPVSAFARVQGWVPERYPQELPLSDPA